MKRDDRKEVREGALTICASGEQYKDQPPPGPLAPIIRIEQVDTPVYTGKNERLTRRTFQLSATVNTLDELDVLLAKMRAELLAAEITPTDIGKLTVIHREKSLLRPPRRGE